MLVTNNLTQIGVETALLERITQELCDRDVELVFASSDEVHDINREFRGKDATTDVLSFPLEDVPHAPLGTILINLELAQKSAQEFAHTLEAEVGILFIHGLLHLLGYDHESDSGEQASKEEELRSKYDLPKTLIERA